MSIVILQDFAQQRVSLDPTQREDHVGINPGSEVRHSGTNGVELWHCLVLERRFARRFHGPLVFEGLSSGGRRVTAIGRTR